MRRSRPSAVELRIRSRVLAARGFFWNFFFQKLAEGQIGDHRRTIRVGPLCRAPGRPDFLEFFSRNSLLWKYGLNYTLTNGRWERASPFLTVALPCDVRPSGTGVRCGDRDLLPPHLRGNRRTTNSVSGLGGPGFFSGTFFQKLAEGQMGGE
jgi:hypothetical protein